jgi:hypothetical protein
MAGCIVYVLVANNTSDFHADDIWLAADSEEAINDAFNATMLEYWNAMDDEGKEFYETYDKYTDVWRTEVNRLPVHPLPTPEEKKI